jgi:hypothetical protein
MDEQSVDDIKNALREMMQLIAQRGQPLSDQMKIQLARVMEHAATRITQIREQERQQQQQPPEAPNQPPVSNDAQLLWILSGQQPQAFISYLRTYPTPDTQALLNNPIQLNATIEQLSRMMPQGEQPSIHGIQQADLNSSNIWGTAYDPKTGKMKVRFQGGSEYEYDGVPMNIYNAFAKGNASAKTKGRNRYGEWWPNKNPSMGAAMNQYIKAGGFNYRKIR